MGTVTEIHDYLLSCCSRASARLLSAPFQTARFANRLSDGRCGVGTASRHQIDEHTRPRGEHLQSLHEDLFAQMQAQGFVRFRVRSGGGTANASAPQIYDVDNLPALKKRQAQLSKSCDRIKAVPQI